jgi:hypothetical protein
LSGILESMPYLMHPPEWSEMTTRLQQARKELGWSQDRVIRELRKRVGLLHVQLGSDASVKTQISRHENGRIVPDRDWCEAYRLVYGLTDEELGLGKPVLPGDPDDDLMVRLATARAVSAAEVGIMRQQVEHIRALDRQLGAPAVLEQLRALMATMTGLLTYSLRPGNREQLAAVLADAGALAGWQALDVGSVGQAWRHYETAKSAAMQADSDALLAHAMGEQSFALLDVGETQQAVELVRQARGLTARSGPRLLTAWLHAAEAEAHAAAREDPECRRSLDAADAALPAEAVDPALPYIFLSEAHLARWRGNCLIRLGDSAAVEHSLAALAVMDSTFTRAEAGLRCDLAEAMLILGEQQEAARYARLARQLALRVGSVRQRRRVGRLASIAARPDG